jgi:hypothetical protein
MIKIVEKYNEIKDSLSSLQICEVYINLLRRMAVPYNTFLIKNVSTYSSNISM